MRHLLSIAALLGAAACTWQPIAPAEAPAPPGPPLIALDLPFPTVPSFLAAPGPGRFTLNNFSFDRAHILAVATASPDCATRLPGEVETEFDVPLNGTRLMIAPPGADICWKRQLVAGETVPELVIGWTGWNRAYVAQGSSVNARM